jgi:hypothetical protein
MMPLNPDEFYGASQFLENFRQIQELQEQSRGVVTGAQGDGSITAIVNSSGEIEVTDTRNFGNLAFLNAAANTASVLTPNTSNVPAQAIDAAYNQTNLQATINALVAAQNAQNTLILEQKTVINALLAALQTANIQA